jgi:hypothetical protein
LNASFVDLVIEAQKPMLVMYSVQTYVVLYMGWSHHGCKLSQMEVLPEVKVGGVVVWSGRRRRAADPNEESGQRSPYAVG